MAQPANLPRWDTSALNITDPPSGQKDSGFVASSALNSSYLNWLFNTLYLWAVYLKNLTSEALTWTVAQTFGAGIVVTQSILNADAIVATPNGTGYALRSNGPVTGDGGAGNAAYNATGSDYGFSSVALKGSIFQGSHATLPTLTLMQAGAAATLKLLGGSAAETLNLLGGSGGLAGTFGAVFVNNAGQAAAQFRGGATSGATGAKFLGADNAADGATVSGVGSIHQGGSPASGTGSPGLSATGGTNSTAAVFQGGTGSTAPGLMATGATTGAGGPGVRANNGAGTFGKAMDVRGTVDFTGATLPATNAQLTSELTRNSFAKAWALIQLNGTAAPSLVDGLNISAVSQAISGGSNGDITITLAKNMASADYAVKSNWQDYAGGAGRKISFQQGTQTNTVVTLRTFVVESGVTVTATDTNGSRIFVEWFGAQ